jgi:hypothetical protein
MDGSESEKPSNPPRKSTAWEAAGLAALVLVVMSATLGDLGFTWDEGYTVERVDRLREWFHQVAGDDSPEVRAWTPPTSKLGARPGGTAGPWNPEVLRFCWPFAREEPNGHPPFYALLSLAGLETFGRFLPPPASYRFGPACLFALTLGAVYAFMAGEYGRVAGLVSALGLGTMPRVFAHAHLASYDVPTLGLWFLAVATFRRAVAAEGRGPGLAWSAAFGLAWGCAMATKLTGWFLPIPLIAWALVYRDRRAALVLAAGASVAALVLFALIPTWWSDPIGGLATFLHSNLGREVRSPIPTLFFGRVYGFALPWWNTLAWTAIVVPPATLALGLAGIGRVVLGRFRDRPGSLLLACWAFLMALRALPNAPGHDGERQFLPAFVFLACLAGIGSAWLADRLAGSKALRVAALGLVGSALLAGAWSTWRFHPVQLAYYNILIGGPAGAARAGLEPTFYWDAFTPEAREWVNQNTPLDRSVMIADEIPSFDYLHHWGLLRPSHEPSLKLPPRWFLLQNRPGILRSYPRQANTAFILDHATPRHATTAPGSPSVPLVGIYDIEDAASVERELMRNEWGR